MVATDYQANLTDGTYSVDILLMPEGGIEDDFDKELVIIGVPKQTPILTYLIDLKKLKRVLTVKGWLEHDSSTTGLERKLELVNLMSRAGTMTLSWGSQSHVVNIIKCKIREVTKVIDAGDLPDDVHKTFEVTIQCAVGTHKG